jgi:predicted RNA-binding Zn-ribbon protein involved in translation (DUF1610 family)
MPAFYKKGKVVTELAHTKKLCPHCGHDDFKITASKMSWLLGEKFKCSKCGGTFKKANLVHVKGKTHEFRVDRKGTTQSSRARRPRHR